MVIVRKAKGTTARTKRFLARREPKWIEDPKTTLLVRTSTSSALVNEVLADLHALKSPYTVHFKKKNELRPFEDSQTIEFFSEKNCASLVLIGSHTKKRPQNLVFARTFDNQLLDMMEFGIQHYTSIRDVQGPTCASGIRPLLLFHGPWDSSNPRMKSMLADFFHGYTTSHLDLTGVQQAVAFTYTDTVIYLRTYTVHLKKSGERAPRVELQPMGPMLDLVPRRCHDADDAVWKRAHQHPSFMKSVRQGKKVKNVERDTFGDVYGQVHFAKQNLDGLQTRKMKGLRTSNKSED